MSDGATPAPAPEAALDATDADASNHADAEGAEADGDSKTGSDSTVRDLLLQTGPETPLEDLESPWDPDRGGVTRIYRGINKMADWQGMPAIGDIGIGLIEAAVNIDLEGGDDDAGEGQRTEAV